MKTKVALLIFKNIKFMADENQTMYEKLKASCPCGSGKSYVECCGKGEVCPCGSRKKAIDCCFVSPETHQ